MTFAFTFPGQGSQSVGMGLSLHDAYPAAARVFEEVDEALGEKLSALIFEGPEEALRLTANTQPALMAVSLAAMRALESEGVKIGEAALVAGHSLGEYSALAAAGALSISDAARLLRLRGEAMQTAVPAGEGAMAALLGLDLEAAEEVAKLAAGDQVCDVANDNAPGQVVVSGDVAAVERAVAIAKEKGAKRAMMLPVSAPFHCGLMAPAAEAMKDALSTVAMKAPVVPVLANVSLELLTDPEAIKASLVRQVTERVRWRESVLKFGGHGVSIAAEIGAGKVLTGLAKRIDKSLETMVVNGADDVKRMAEHWVAAA
ncbi:[acyl-carrier-protein] S-malonyltransferase [Acuticoccus sediminis]|uniref:Malonyl CoA-acyl carrier protein transacylase n=1 Tax=Acuticoccus sediminis TaxID=2184697 RepID=A0A8B2NKA1_9HYPH|nr:ACP S-malonyltransferase [Acuticoccus sediminis]RAH98917.1 [acyl-carrier-protein] S-malonyltransferase [Acuticoccus sediminis]